MAIKNKRELTTIQLVINGQQAKTTLTDIRAATVSVERELSRMKKADDPAGWKKLTQQAQQLRRAQADLTSEIRGGTGALSNLRSGWMNIAKGFVGGSMLMVGIGMLKKGLSELISLVRTLSDELADIQKTTGLSAAATRNLNLELQKIDTRTPVSELRRLATEAGRLGYTAEEDILGFVRAADQIQVALGDVLGDDATKDMAKIVDIFKLDDIYGVEGGLLRIGSAINEIGMASTANEGYVVDFVKRMSGISGVANIGAAEVIAMAGTLDALGQSSEVGSTALSKVMTKMGSDVPTYAKLAGKSVDEFRKVLERSAMEGLLMVLENVGKTTEGIEALSATLGDLGLDGGRVVGIFGTLSKNTEEYRRQLEIATSAIEKGTSVTDEFAIRNTNANAVLERFWKKVTNWAENLSLKLEGPIIKFGLLTGVISKAEVAMWELQKQEEFVAQSEKNLAPLITRYHELQKAVEDGTASKNDLNAVIRDIAAIVPEAVSEWGAYGEAIGFNIEKVNDFIEAQRRMIEIRRQERREALQQEAEEIQKEASQIAYDKNLGKRFQMVGTSMVEMRISDAEMRMLSQKERELQNRLNKIEKDLLAIDGIVSTGATAATAGGKTVTTTTTTTTTTGSGNGGKDALKEREKLLKEIEKNDQQIFLSRLSADMREIEQARFKYEELRKQAKGHSEEIKRINAQEVQELAMINEKQQREWLKNADKSIRAELVRMNKLSKEKSEFEKEQMDATLKAQGLEADLINRKYQALLVQYQQFGMDTTTLYIQWAQELQKVTEKTIAATAKSINDAIKKDKKGENESARENDRLISDKIRGYQALGDVMSEVLSLTASNREENAKFEAQLALFQLAIDSAVAISSAVTLGAKSSTNVWTMVATIGTAVTTVLAGIGRAKKLFEQANAPEAPAFRADGGPTDLSSIYMDKSGNPEGWVNRPTFYQLGRRSYVAGEAGREYVISNAMLKNPYVADFAAMLEALRQQRYFAGGGSTAIAPQPTVAERASTQPSYNLAVLSEMKEQNKLLRALLSKPSGINYDIFERYQQQVESIRTRSSA